MYTKIMFVRNDSFGVSNYGFICVESKESDKKEVLLAKLNLALNEWMETTDEGAKAWSQSSEDFNIGDLCHVYTSDSLIACLLKQDISIDIEMGDQDACASYDTVLASPNI
jgi:hypothetical protein